QLIAQAGIEALDVAVLPGAAPLDVGGLGTDNRDPVLYRLGDELWSVVGPDVSGNAPQDEQVGQNVDHIDGLELAGDTDRQTFVGELVEHVEHPVLATIVGAILDEVIGPDMIALLRPQPDELGNSSDQPGSIIRLVESMLGRKIFPGITGAAFLTSAPASVFANQSASLAEHTRNYILYYIAHVTGLLRAVTTAGVVAEHQDTLMKLLKLSLLIQLPTLQGGWMTCFPGEYEFIHANRMRCPPRISFQGLPSHY